MLSRAITPRYVRGDVRSLGTITWDDIGERSLTELTLARSLKLADLTERSVLGRYGVAGDISTSHHWRAT